MFFNNILKKPEDIASVENKLTIELDKISWAVKVPPDFSRENNKIQLSIKPKSFKNIISFFTIVKTLLFVKSSYFL
jgi:hypothetical protein